jgi:hypothetical protein
MMRKRILRVKGVLLKVSPTKRDELGQLQTRSKK